MSQQAPTEEHSSILRNVMLLAIPLLAAVVAGMAAVYSRAAGFTVALDTADVNFTSAIFLAIGLVIVLFYGLKRHPERSARIIVAGVAVAGTISGLVLLKVWVQAVQASPVFFLASLPIGYMGLNWSMRGYFGALSPRKTHVLMIGSATLLGSLVGTSFPPLFSIIFLTALVSLDVVIVETHALPGMVGEDAYEKMITVATLPVEKYFVGLGDFLAYAIVVTTALQLFGVWLAMATTCLVVIGATLTFEITKRRSRAPGLLLPVGLVLLPIILGIIIL